MVTKKKEPLVRCNGTMSESQFLAWVRSALRSKSLSWKPRAEALRLARRAYKGPNKRQSWEYLCSMCGDWHMGKNCQVDHFPVSCGSILSTADIGNFVNNLYCETDNLRVLCSNCHSIHTLCERNGISKEEATLQKAVNTLIKDKTAKQLLDYLSKNNYSGASVSNAEKRKKAVYEILKEKNDECI